MSGGEGTNTAPPVDGCDCHACGITRVSLLQRIGLTRTEILRAIPSRMIVCSICGNKRCPHATDHRLACTNSNEPGQPGSLYARAGAPE